MSEPDGERTPSPPGEGVKVCSDIVVGDCIDTMRRIADCSVDALVSDPPYGVDISGRGWDDLGEGAGMQQWHAEWCAEALRVLKPGAWALVFSATRTYHRLACAMEDVGFEIRDCIAWMYGQGWVKSRKLAGDWEGWSTTLKPSFEPIVVGKKSADGTVLQNLILHGVGAMNVQACRLEGDRWPPNVAIDPEAAEILEAQREGATKFFFCPKPGRREREAGLDALPKSRAGTFGDKKVAAANVHPTVKPIELMRWLVRLVAPPGGTVLDPFIGSGSTGVACALEGFNFIGAEREPDYANIARARVAYWASEAGVSLTQERSPLISEQPALRLVVSDAPPSAPVPLVSPSQTTAVATSGRMTEIAIEEGWDINSWE